MRRKRQAAVPAAATEELISCGDRCAVVREADW
jgi:hypothetical protein